MKAITFLLIFGVILTNPIEHPANKTATKPVVVLELFTSEGCSSCPPADALLNSIIDENEKKDTEIYALSFHVDYWNHLGWKDPFSSSQFSERQREYAEQFGSGSYTPQLVANGNKEFVGSNKKQLHETLAEALLVKNEISLRSKLINNNQIDLQKLEVNYEVSGNSKNTVINICLVQKEAITFVQRGENSGRKLVHKNIVRVLKTQKIIQSSGQVSLEVPKGLTQKDCSIIAFTQTNNHQITGATSLKSILKIDTID